MPSCSWSGARTCWRSTRLNANLPSSDFSIDAELIDPGVPAGSAEPSPGARNRVYAAIAPPQIRQVDHTPAVAAVRPGGVDHGQDHRPGRGRAGEPVVPAGGSGRLHPQAPMRPTPTSWTDRADGG